jgi:low affinity Fe/Cu permease
MNPIARLFSKNPSASEIDDQLKELELDQKKKRRDLIMLEQKKQERVMRAVEAKKAGKQSLVMDLFREVSQIEIEIGHANSDLRRLSLAKAALNSFLRKMQLLEQKKDRKGLQKLIERFRDSSIQKTIDKADVNDDTFNELLEDVLGAEEEAAGQSQARDDLGFAEFERTITAMARVEEPCAVEISPEALPAYGVGAGGRAGQTPHVRGSAELEQELAFVNGKIAEVQGKLDEVLRQEAKAREEAAAMHRAARDLMANPDTYDQGVEMEAKAKAMDDQESSLRSLIETLINMIKALEDQKRAIMRNMA